MRIILRKESFHRYTKLNNNCEIPESLVKIKNNYALITIRNTSENPEHLTIDKPFRVEKFEKPNF